MINNIDVEYTRDNALSLRQFIKQYNISLDDNVVVQDFYLREYSLRGFMLKRCCDLDMSVSEAYCENECLTIVLSD